MIKCHRCKEDRDEQKDFIKSRKYCKYCSRKAALDYLHRSGKHKTYKGCPRNNLTDKKFGMLLVTPETYMQGKDRIWICICDCGQICKRKQKHLLAGTVNSCGCIRNRSGNKARLWGGYEEISGNYWGRIKNGYHKKNGNKQIIPVDITIKEAWEKFLNQNRKCAITGIELEFRHKKNEKSKQTASLDRIDSNKGYTKENTQWVHKRINLMKSNMTTSELVAWAELIVKHSNRKM